MSADMTDEIRARYNRAMKLKRYSKEQCIELVAQGLGIDTAGVRDALEAVEEKEEQS